MHRPKSSIISHTANPNRFSRFPNTTSDVDFIPSRTPPHNPHRSAYTPVGAHRCAPQNPSPLLLPYFLDPPHNRFSRFPSTTSDGILSRRGRRPQNPRPRSCFSSLSCRRGTEGGGAPYHQLSPTPRYRPPLTQYLAHSTQYYFSSSLITRHSSPLPPKSEHIDNTIVTQNAPKPATL
jgi:hypothetical protein